MVGITRACHTQLSYKIIQFLLSVRQWFPSEPHDRIDISSASTDGHPPSCSAQIVGDALS